MSKLSVSYGILIDNSWQSNNSNSNNNSLIHHILPITKILTLPDTNNYFLTSSRDGSLIWHDILHPSKNIKLQIHSDWISDVLYWNSDLVSNSFKFISVSHDFSINFIHIYSNVVDNNNSSYCWTYDWKIIGYHQDYIKCLQRLNHNTFVTAGLDNFINIWSIDNKNSTVLVKSFYNTYGSLYTLQCLPTSTVSNRQLSLPFDIIVGDCNGNLLFYHSLKDDLIFKITAHDTNIKCIKLLHNYNSNTLLLLSTCSNGICKIWNLNDLNNPLYTFHWLNNAVVWSIGNYPIHTNNIEQLLITDSRGHISKFSFDFDTFQYSIDLLYHDLNYNQRHPGILTSTELNNKLYFSYCSNSDLNILDLPSRILSIERGGTALTRSSLLTNRRHVITENTDGIVQRWDILSCELIDTFDPKEGDFDDIVIKYTTNEILSHWCTVSIKVGILFVKIGPKFTNTEIYGSAFKGYELLNSKNKKSLDKKSKERKRHIYHYSHLHSNKNSDIENVGNDDIINNINENSFIINDEIRYNLGKVVINSLFHEFMQWEINKDIKYREKLLASIDTPNVSSNSLVTNDADSNNNIESFPNKQKKKNAFTSLAIATSHFKSKDSSTNNSPLVSTPSTPNNEVNMNFHIHPNNTINKNSNHHKSHEDLLSNTLAESSDLSLSQAGSRFNSRALSSGSIFTRRFKSFRNNSNSSNNNSANDTSISNINRNDIVRTPVFPSSVNMETSHSIPVSKTCSQNNFNNNTSQRKNLPRGISTDSSNLSASLSKNEIKKPRHEFMSDLISEIHESYKEGLQTQSLTLSKFGLSKRKIESQIKRNEELPIIKVKSNTLLLVQSWNEGSCGGKVLFSTVLPTSTAQSPFHLQSFSSPALSKNQSTNSLISNNSSMSSLDNAFDKCSISSRTSDHSSISSASSASTSSFLYSGEDNVVTPKKDKSLSEKQYRRNKKLFTKIERNLPYWMGVLLCKDDTVVQEKQPTLNFVILPWVPEDQQDAESQAQSSTTVNNQHHHHSGFRLGKSKSNDVVKNSMMDLPKICESNIKLIAPGMIKVKKIKNYVVDRFESKTPEMKDKIDPSIWVELLCKGHVLDNDMTLSTVRTLYWKSPGEITIHYRRKVSR